MKEFGETSVFSIQYLLEENPYNEQGVLGKSWGKFKLWVKGKELCGFNRDAQSLLPYTANLIYIVEWFCENLENILEDDPLDLPVQGNNALELYQNSLKLKTDDEQEQDHWFEIRQDWFSRHNWFWNRGGSFLAEIFFRRIQDNIEIAWDNRTTYRKQGIRFENSEGVQYVPLKIFRNVVIGFLHSIIDELSTKVPLDRQLMDIREKLLLMQKS